MEGLSCSWSPVLIVDIIKNTAWPIVVLLIGFSFRIKISEVAQSFFSKNTVSEISATVTGLSAKFIAAKQSTEILEIASSSTANLPNSMSLEAITKSHDEQKTEYSEGLFQSIITHMSSLDIDDEKRIEIIARELSLFQSALKFFSINKVLFRSQYNLFSSMADKGGCISKEDALLIFDKTKSNKEVLSDWDWIKYIAYPISNGLIYEDNNNYKLTSFGVAYVSFMSKSPQFIDELSKL